jgi:hypothetical protein
MTEGLEIRVPVGARFSPPHFFQTGFGAHPATYPVITGDFFPEVKRQVHEADKLPPSSAEVKNTWIYSYTPP